MKKETFGSAPKFTTFFCMYNSRISICLGNAFPSHPKLPLAFPMVEFAMSKIFLSKNKWPANSMSEIILEFLYFVTELVLHAQRPMKAVPSIQGQSRSFCGVRRHIVSKNAAINFLHVCGGLY